MHFLTSSQKAYPNLRHQFTHGMMDSKSFTEFSKFLNAVTAVSFAKPTVGLSTHACTLSRAETELSALVTNGLFGTGVDNFVRGIKKIQHELCTLDSTSDAPGNSMPRVRDAFEKTSEYSRKRVSKSQWKDLVLSLRMAGVRLLHYSQAVQELMPLQGAAHAW